MIDFTATWCPPCRRIGPIYEAMAAKYPEVTLKKIDVDKNKEAARAAGVQAMPTFKVWVGGQEYDMLRGANEAKLTEMLERAKEMNG